MITDAADFVAFLRQEIDELQIKKAQIITQGSCKDWTDYRASVAYIEALQDVRKAILVVAKRNDDERIN